MLRDEWFRSPRWDAAERERFEAKLARARSANRAQYLRLKGLALSAASERTARFGARELERVLASGDELQAAMARADLARWLEQAALPREAANMYRECLQAEISWTVICTLEASWTWSISSSANDGRATTTKR